MLRYGGNPQQSNRKGETPLKVANSPTMVNLLLGKGTYTSSEESSTGQWLGAGWGGGTGHRPPCAAAGGRGGPLRLHGPCAYRSFWTARTLSPGVSVPAVLQASSLCAGPVFTQTSLWFPPASGGPPIAVNQAKGCSSLPPAARAARASSAPCPPHVRCCDSASDPFLPVPSRELRGGRRPVVRTF